MEADGWALNADGVYEKDGVAAEFTVTCMDEPGRQGIIMAVKEMLDAFGIKINIKGGMSWDEIDPTTYSTPNIIGGGMFSPMGDVSRYYTGKNRACYSNPTVDKHMDDGLAAASVEESYEHFKLAAWDGTTGFMTDADCPWVFVVTVKQLYFVREGLRVVEEQIFPHGYGWAICDNANRWYWE
jgi:peptide/nickel transport system substrate-binding protein